MSLGGVLECKLDSVGSLISAINDARKSGSVVVVAAGNENINVKQVTPGGCKNVVSVAASDQRGYLAPYSNYGDVTIMAPGGDVKRDDDNDGFNDGVWSLVSTSEQNPTGVAAYEGTSMATPHVSATLALAIAQDEKLRNAPDKLEKILKKSAPKNCKWSLH